MNRDVVGCRFTHMYSEYVKQLLGCCLFDIYLICFRLIECCDDCNKFEDSVYLKPR